MAQKSITYFYYVQNQTGTDPFVVWLTQVSMQQQPTHVNTISCASVEKLVSASNLSAWHREACSHLIDVLITAHSKNYYRENKDVNDALKLMNEEVRLKEKHGV